MTGLEGGGGLALERSSDPSMEVSGVGNESVSVAISISLEFSCIDCQIILKSIICAF